MARLNSIGLNRRNFHYISQYNKRIDFPLVDDKVLCKKILNDADIPTPKTIGVVDKFIHIPRAIDFLKAQKDFVIKPARGRAGGGIKLLTSENRKFLDLDNKEIHEDKLKKHLGDIIFGVYSFGKMNDAALIEKKIVQHDVLNNLYNRGVADIRVILFKSEPIMAMARIPTSSSDGKANLHQGALGIGIDLETGKTTSASIKGKPLLKHPDSNEDLIHLQIPHFKEIIDYSVKASKTVPLEYLGVDIVLDNVLGPLILEMNARPGLQIQTVNNMGLGSRLKELE